MGFACRDIYSLISFCIFLFILVVEDLNVKGMQQNPYLSKSISDSGFGKFLRYLEYKADWYERTLIIVDRFYPSSKLCNVFRLFWCFFIFLPT
jgi:IS605 OrfB family transposase